MAPAAAVAPSIRQPSPLRVGTVVWLASELMFFAGLFAAYFTLRGVREPWPPSGVELDTGRAALFTGVLVVSSATMHLSVRAAEHDRQRRAVAWMLVTFGLGAVFVANQALEYAAADFTFTSHAYGSMFFLMTGFHALHVVGGLVLMVAVLGVGTGATTRAPLAGPAMVTEYYWHFVDVVWLAMFATLFLVR